MNSAIPFVTLFVVLGFASSTCRASGGGANTAPIGRLVRARLAQIDSYQPGDIVSRAQAKDVIASLERKGVNVPDPDAVVQRCLSPESTLWKLSRTERGKRFLRQIGKIPGGYRRLDRLSQLPQGDELVRTLERDPGGEKLVEYLATTAGGRELGRMLAKTPSWVNPNQPTDRIYTADDLIAALEEPANNRQAGAKSP